MAAGQRGERLVQAAEQEAAAGEVQERAARRALVR